MNKNRQRSIGILLLAFCALIAVMYWRVHSTESARDIERETTSARIEGMIFEFEIARTAAQHKRGLQYRDSLAERHGMLFVFSSETTPVFWMKNTRIPLDIVWVNDQEVVDITEQIPTQLGVADSQLTRYTPKNPVNAVLELNAGEVQRYGIRIGSIVEWVP